jgi:Xylose isomerase-like TIM barrel
MLCSRRDITRLALAVVPGAGWLARPAAAAAMRQAARPNSRFAGVQLGMNAPYNFGSNAMSADETLSRCLQLGISAVELRSQPVEGFLGVPPALVAAGATGRDELRKWRVAVSMDRVSEFRKKYEDAGVRIEIVKFDGMYARADDELDYCFRLATALGARAISCEIDVPGTKRVGQFADQHRLMVGYHGHAETGPADWERAFSYAKYNGANLDIGHFVAGQNSSPVPFLTQHHDRITHIHVKDRRMNKGPNVPFGEGDTPIVEVLQLIRDNKWNIQATIEFEYPVPPGSDRMTEIGKCVEYCRKALI